MSRSLCDLGAHALVAGYRARDFSPVEVLQALAERIARRDGELNAFTTLCLERAGGEAAAAEREYEQGGARPLAGVPLAVKDLMDTAGVATSYGSAMFAGHVPAADAVAVARARAAGAVVVGKTLTHEFAWGITSQNPHFGACRNPWAPDRVPGGSSGGSAVAVAVGECPLALGTDTGGSVRIPAAFCGVIGMKPTFGRVDTGGVFPLAPSLDHVGTFGRTVADARLLLAVIAADRPAAAPGREPSLAGRRVALCRDLHFVAPSPAVVQAYAAAVAAVERAGGEVVDLSFPHADAIRPAFAAIQLAEALEVHRSRGLYPERSEEYGADVRRRLEAAERVSNDELRAARAERERVRADFAALFADADLLLTPVSAGPPVRIGDDSVEHLGAPMRFRELVLGYTVPQNLAGLPACSVPVGRDEWGVPIGLQITGPAGADDRVLEAADALHRLTRPSSHHLPAGPRP